MAMDQRMVGMLAKRSVPPLSARKRFLSSSTQEMRAERQAELVSSQNTTLQLKNKVREGKRDLELRKRQRAETDDPVCELQARVMELTHEAVKHEKKLTALEAENSAIKSINREMMEMFGRCLGGPLESPGTLPVSYTDPIRQLKGSHDTARSQQARRNSAKRAEAAAEKEEAAVPPRVQRQAESESEDETNTDHDEALFRQQQQSWATFFDMEALGTRKRKGGLGRTAGEYDLRSPEAAKSEHTPARDHSSSESEGSSTPRHLSRTSRSGVRERESVPDATLRKIPARSYAKLTPAIVTQNTLKKRNASNIEVRDDDFTGKTRVDTPVLVKKTTWSSLRQPSFAL